MQLKYLLIVYIQFYVFQSSVVTLKLSLKYYQAGISNGMKILCLSLKYTDRLQQKLSNILDKTTFPISILFFYVCQCANRLAVGT